jgi:Na+-translocating ferredoxin:NAD+ oxidoreductase RnfG subunit
MDILAVVASCGALFLAGANVCVWMIIKFNDLKHQESALARIEKNQESTDKKLDKIGERIATIEGKCSANHGS